MARWQTSPPKVRVKWGFISRLFRCRPWRQVAGPDLGPNSSAAVVPDGPDCQWKGGTFERLEAQNRAALQAHFVKLAMPPANLLGGYRFSGASTAAEFGLIKIEPVKSASIDLINRPDLIIPDDLSIPEFLKRTDPAVSATAADADTGLSGAVNSTSARIGVTRG